MAAAVSSEGATQIVQPWQRRWLQHTTVLAETARIAGPVPNKVGSRRPGDSRRLVGDIAKSKLELGWTPTRDLATQIEDTLRWRRKMAR